MRKLINKKVDCQESWLMRKLIDEKVDWLESLLGYGSVRMHVRTDNAGC